MENNYFNEEQLNIIFSDKGFVDFFSNYFSSFANDEILSQMDLVEGDIDELWRLYIRLFLSNIEEAISSISKIERNMSFSYEEQRMSVSGGIKGRLLFNEYVQSKPLVRIPREYPCVVKKRGIDTPENEYYSHIVLNLTEKLRRLINLYVEHVGNMSSTEYQRMNDVLNYFSSVLRKQPAAGIIGKIGTKILMKDFSESRFTELQYRFVKNKVRNAYEYHRLFDWYDKYKKGVVKWLKNSALSMLIYDDEFRNKLFELWNLYRISDTLRNSFDFVLLSENRISVQMDNWVYEYLSKDCLSKYKIYYQKGRGLYWDEKHSQFWNYIDANGNKKALRGIPDITVTIEGPKNKIVLIDLKNRVRDSGGNSEEIYKIIGYYSNFSEYLNSKYADACQRKGMLIFRNDNTSFDERIVSESGECITTFSTSPENNQALNDDQFNKICQEII